MTPFLTICQECTLVAPSTQGDLPMGMLNMGNARVSLDCAGPRHIPYGIKGSWEGSLQGNYVLDLGCGVRGSHLSQLCLKGRLGFKVRSIGHALFKG